MVVSSTSMKVGTITAAATSQGLTARRLTAGGARATLLMRRAPWRTRTEVRGQRSECSFESLCGQRGSVAAFARMRAGWPPHSGECGYETELLNRARSEVS